MTAANKEFSADETKASEEKQKEAAAQLPEINFSTFVFSLNQSAMMHLGIIGDPGSGKQEKNLMMAKQTIDILGMLEEKTKGNLSQDEVTMLRSILYDLRIIYVKQMS